MKPVTLYAISDANGSLARSAVGCVIAFADRRSADSEVGDADHVIELIETRPAGPNRGPDLKTRAVAAMCALRTGARAKASLRVAIGDTSTASTLDLLGDLRDLGLVAMRGGGDWHLTWDGIAWCETQGMPVTPEAKADAFMDGGES